MLVAKALLLLCIITYSMSPVTCLKCYNCNSWDKPDCEKNPKSIKDAEMDCDAPFDECMTITGKMNGKDGLLRYCSLSSASEDEIKNTAKTVLTDLNPEKVTKRCKTDLCNAPSSGSHLSIGLWSLIGAFLSLSVGKP